MHNPFTSTVRVDEGLNDQIEAAQEGQYAVIVRPPEESDTDPREAAEEVFQAIHGELDSISFEIIQTPNGRIEFQTITDSWEAALVMRNRILAEVNGAVEIVEGAELGIARGETVAGARLDYAKDHIVPLKTLKSHEGSDDPYSQVFETIAEEPDSRTVIQFIITPVDYSRPFRWGYWLLSHWDERIVPTWTTRWSRWKPPSLATDRRQRRPSLEVASLLSLAMYLLWIVIGNNPIAALPSIQLLDAMIPATTLGPVPGFGPVHVPADLSTFIFGRPESIDLTGKLTYALMMLVVGTLYFAALFGVGLERPERWNADTQGDLAREKGDNDDRRASRSEREAAEAIAQQGRDLGYRINARVLTIGEDASSVVSYRESIVQQFTNSWRSSATKQHLRGTPMGRFGHVHHRLPRFIGRVARREPSRTRWFWVQKVLFQSRRRKPMYVAPFELSSFAYWPVKSKGGAAAIEYVPPPDTQPLVDDGDVALDESEPEILPDATAPDDGESASSDGERSEESPDDDPFEPEPDPPQYND